MQKNEYENIYRNEKTHFYYQAINGLVLDLLRREKIKEGDKVLDAGCGTGGLLLKMTKEYDAQGIDISPEALKYCKAREVKAQTGSLEKLPFKSESFEAITSIDVIYHKYIKDDTKAVSELARVLKPGGLLILRVPAFNFLKNEHDRVVMTNKRYTGKELKDLAKKVNLEVVQISYLNPSLFIGSLISKIFSHSRAGGNLYGWIPAFAGMTGAVHSSVYKINPFINWLGFVVLSLENLLVRVGLAWPIGQGVILVARKLDSDKLKR